jgi:hypothetical protein
MLEELGTTANFPAAANTAPDMREFFKGNGTASAAGAIKISAPTASTVTGPSVHAVADATAPNPITTMRIYVNNVSVHQTSSSHVDTVLSLAKGTHSVVFQAWDSKGNVYKAPKTITVQ